MSDGRLSPPFEGRAEVLYHFCRLQMPAISLGLAACRGHLRRTYELYSAKQDAPVPYNVYLDNLYPLDWFTACACLEGQGKAWEYLFAARVGRTDCLLMDALRSRAARMYPRDEERQESAVNEFWGHLYVADTPNSKPVLARYDGQRPLVPWLIRVFHNWHISQLRKHSGVQALPDDDYAIPAPVNPTSDRWHDLFSHAAREWLDQLGDNELLILGLRTRYRMSQREVARLLEVHEGTISRRMDQLRDQSLEFIRKQMVESGWTGDDLFEYIRTEMQPLLTEDPRLSADHLASLLAAQGKALPG